MDDKRKDYVPRIDYSAAIKDQELIDKIKSNYDLNKLSDVEEICQMLINGKIKFESSVGNDFDDELFELKEKLEKSPSKGNTKPSMKSSNELKKTDKTKPSAKRKSFNDLDDEMKDLVLKEYKKQRTRKNILILVLSVASVSLIVTFFLYYYKTDRTEKRYQELSGLVGSEAMSGGESGYTATITEDGTVVPEVLDMYKTLYNSNKNLIGWLKIDDTNIDYPVMQCGDNEFYLTHNFDSEEDVAGTLFLDCNCDVINGSDNYIIYGHHLQSGRMFSSLVNYEDQSFYESHKYIIFDTIYEQQVYQVMFVFRSRVYSEDEVVFKYYQFIDANSEEEFNSYMLEMENIAFYDTGVRAFYGDSLLTLSTCDYHEDNGRFVVVAKRIK